MLYFIAYALHAYEPGAYDDFYEALAEVTPQYRLPSGEVIARSDLSIQMLSAALGKHLDEADCLYVVAFDRGSLAGTITEGVDLFLARSQPRDAFGRVVA